MSRPAEPELVESSPRRPADDAGRQGSDLIRDFYMVAKTAAMFEYTNVVTREAVAAFLATVRSLLKAESRLTLQMASDCVFVNEARLKVDFEGFAAFRYVVEAMKNRDIGTILIRGEPTEEELRVFLTLFIENDARVEEARKRIEEGLSEAGVDVFELEELRDLPEHVTKTSETAPDEKETAVNTYFKSVFIAKQFIENVRGSRANLFGKAKRVVHSIVDMVVNDDTTLLALTHIKNFDDFLFTHSANVCVLSVAIGQQMGLGKALLGHLGIAALMHDVGMTEIERGILGRQGDLTPAERTEYCRHPELGARTILKSQGLTESAIRCVLVSYEHHLLDDGSGFPLQRAPRPRNLLSRIVALADLYDTLTTPDANGTPTCTPTEAIELLSERGSGLFDAALIKVLVNTLGTYPVGSTVRLDTGETGIILSRPSQLTPHSMPVVKIIAGPDGQPVPPFLADLNETDPESGDPRRSIVETLPSSTQFDDVHEFTELL
jgi:HD-GYP domain-containing protein (c-di-GMP phosphodiesterase class II)